MSGYFVSPIKTQEIVTKEISCLEIENEMKTECGFGCNLFLIRFLCIFYALRSAY